MSPPAPPIYNAWVGPGVDAQYYSYWEGVYIEENPGSFPERLERGGPTVETQANGDPWSTYEGGPFCLVPWARCAITRDFYPALAALFRSITKKFFLTRHRFTSFVQIAQQAWQTVVPRRLSLNKCLWSFLLLATSPWVFTHVWDHKLEPMGTHRCSSFAVSDFWNTDSRRRTTYEQIWFLVPLFSTTWIFSRSTIAKASLWPNGINHPRRNLVIGVFESPPLEIQMYYSQ